VVLAVACGAGAEDAAEIRGDEGRDVPAQRLAGGEVRGVVRDAETDQPLDGAWISAGDLGAGTDEAGVYALTLLPAGPTKLRAYRRGFRAESVTVIVRPGDATIADVELAPAPPPCCRLSGRWNIAFSLDSAGLNAKPTERELSGIVTFSPAAAPSAGEPAAAPQRAARAGGSASFDFAPLLGTGIDARVEKFEGMVFAGDSVAITMIPRFGDWALELLGRQDADTIRGDWFQRASCCGAYGTFVMTRSAPQG
jgi:hypothetical protein